MEKNPSTSSVKDQWKWNLKKRFEKILKGLYRYELEKIYIPLKNGSEALEMAINLLTNLDANIAMSTTFCFKKKTRVTRICEKLLLFLFDEKEQTRFWSNNWFIPLKLSFRLGKSIIPNLTNLKLYT